MMRRSISLAASASFFQREVSYAVLKPQELKRKLAAHDPFLTDVW